MSDRLNRFQKAVTSVLTALMAFVVVLAVIELGWIIAKDVITPPLFLLEIGELLEIFGLFLLVLIGIELFETIKGYSQLNVVHVEVVLLVAMIAVARKIITLEPKDLPPASLAGVASLVAALAVAYFFVHRAGHDGHDGPGQGRGPGRRRRKR